MTPEDLDGLRYDVMTALGQVEPLAELIAHLADSHQRGLGFLTPAARAAMDAQHAADRRDRTTQADRADIGLDWLNRDRDVTPTGHIRAAGTTTALSIDADMTFTFRDLIRTTLAWLYRVNGLCVLGGTPERPTVAQLVARLRVLVIHCTDPDPLLRIYREATRLFRDASQYIDGDDSTRLREDCPFCGRRTLVLLYQDDPAGGRIPHLVRCDRDQQTGRYAPCRCPDEVCECKTRPVEHRHEWVRTIPGVPDARRKWTSLATLLTARRAAPTT